MLSGVLQMYINASVVSGFVVAFQRSARKAAFRSIQLHIASAQPPYFLSLN